MQYFLLNLTDIIDIILDIEIIRNYIFVFAYHCVAYFVFVGLNYEGEFVQKFEWLLVGGYNWLGLDWD